MDRLSTLLQVVGLVVIGGGLFLAPAWVTWIALGVIAAAVGTVLELDEE